MTLGMLFGFETNSSLAMAVVIALAVSEIGSGRTVPSRRNWLIGRRRRDWPIGPESSCLANPLSSSSFSSTPKFRRTKNGQGASFEQKNPI